MGVGAGRPWLGVAGFALLLSLGLSSASWAQSDELSVLNAQVIKLYQAGKYSDASSVAERALALSEQLYGPSHPNVAVALNDLAELYRAEGRYADAEPITRRALAIRETALGRDDPGVAQSLNLLAELCRAQGRYVDAEPLLKRALAIYESAFGPDSLDVAPSLNNLALLYQGEGRYPEAELLYRRALAIMEKTLGPEHSNVAQALNNLADLYREEGHYAEGESLLKRALAIREGAFGPDHPVVAESLTTLAVLYDVEGRYADAEPLLKRALAIDEKALGPDHPDIASLLNDLAELYRVEGRVAEAVPLYERALAIREKALGADHPDLATNINNLALAYVAERRYADAETLYKRALAIDEKALGADHPVVAVLLNNMADPYIAEKRYADAEALLKRALAIHKKALGPDHPDVATDLNSLAVLDHARQRYPESGASLNRVLAIREKALGPDHPEVAIALDNLAWLAFTQQDWAQAAAYWRRSTGILIRRAERGAVGRSQGEKGKSEAERLSWQGRSLVKSAYHIAAAQQEAEPRLAADMFESAQWAQSSEAAQSLAQMAVRGASGKPQLAALVRERQDLLAEWQRGDAARTAAASQPPEKRNKEAEAANTARLSAIDTRIAEIDQELGKDFPEYAALVSPKAMSLADVQGQLGEDEALILFLDTPDWKPTPEETFIWVVSKTESRWVRTDIGTKGLQDRVVALRCGLDYDGSWDVSGSRCAELLETTYSEADHQNGKPLPFDLGRAYTLYTALFGRVGDLIKDKHLLIVPSGALTQLPFQVLVTEQPDPSLIGAEALRQAKWLISGHAVTVLPSVSSLKALRQLAKESHASRALIGFGNPLLDGLPDSYPDDGPRAAKARAKQSCPEAPFQQVASREGEKRGVRPLTLRGGMADVAQIRMQAPLPETADELCAVARDLGVSGDDIRLGAHATESEIERLSGSGDLAKYRMVHFATHGAFAGKVSGNAEPGLLLTPPDQASEADDGYLSASEVAALKLDADWVILSACNTAAGGADGAEALSGLARAFFYAGARALLVSHWSVYSDATVKLITGAVSTMAADKSIGRAEAMRRSMLALIDKGTPDEAHPAYWAPFVVVGEGGVTSTLAVEAAPPVTGAIGAPSATAPLNTEVAPSAPTSIAVPAIQPSSKTSALPNDKQPSSVKKTKKARSKPKTNDWFTSLFGQ